MDIKTEYITAFFKEEGHFEKYQEQVGVEKVEVEKGLFKKTTETVEKPIYENRERWKKTGESDSQIDGERLSRDINDKLKALTQEGWCPISITPILSGSYHHDHSHKGILNPGGYGWGFGYGFSYTEGAVLTLRKG